MKTITKTITTTNPKLVIEYENDPQSPREWDNLGYFITQDRRYNSPDRNELLQAIVKDTSEDATDQNDHIKRIKKAIHEQTNEKVLAIYPIVKYEHSGVSYSLGTKHGFDYLNNGFYIVTDKTAKLLGTPKKSFEKVIAGELETYTKYVNGEVYGYILYNDNGQIEDSVCGFYDIEAIRENLPEEWEDEDLTNYLK